MDLIAKDLTYKPDSEYHLNEVSFGMQKGELYTILGRTLSGKTTLLKTIAGLISPDNGRLLFNDKNFENIPVWERNVAMVYQQFINYPHLTVFENVAFPLRQGKLNEKAVNDRVAASLERVGLLGFESRKIQELSGGQQQRVALARTLAKQAHIILLDEPLVNLDYKLREQLREEFRNLFSSELTSNSILVYSTTDPLEAMQLGGETIVLDQGRVLQQGPAHEIFENPANTRVAEISNDPAMNLLKGEVQKNKIILNRELSIAKPKHFKDLSDGPYIFGIRASDVSIAKNGTKFVVELAEISGSETFLHVKSGEQTLVGLLDSVQDFQSGEEIPLKLDADQLYVFGKDEKLILSPYKGAQ